MRRCDEKHVTTTSAASVREPVGLDATRTARRQKMEGCVAYGDKTTLSDGTSRGSTSCQRPLFDLCSPHNHGWPSTSKLNWAIFDPLTTNSSPLTREVGVHNENLLCCHDCDCMRATGDHCCHSSCASSMSNDASGGAHRKTFLSRSARTLYRLLRLSMPSQGPSRCRAHSVSLDARAKSNMSDSHSPNRRPSCRPAVGESKIEDRSLIHI